MLHIMSLGEPDLPARNNHLKGRTRRDATMIEEEEQQEAQRKGSPKRKRKVFY